MAEDEDSLLRAVALQNAQSILAARRRAEQELLEAKEALALKAADLYQQREWFRVTLSSIGDAVITTDIRGRITFLNPLAEALTVWKFTEATGKPMAEIFTIVDDETRQPAPNLADAVLQGGNTVALASHTALIARDGTEILIEDSAALEQLGYAESDYVGQPIARFHADATVINDILARLNRGEPVQDYEARLRASDGSIRHVVISCNVLREMTTCRIDPSLARRRAS